MSSKRPILVIDAFSVFYRHFLVNESLTTTGEPCGGVIGFIKSISWLAQQFNPSAIHVVWEEGGGSARRKHIFPEYKANRGTTKMVDFNKVTPLKQWVNEDKTIKTTQITTLVNVLKNLPVCQYYVQGVEADDIVAYLCRYKLTGDPDTWKIIVSSDRDFYQLLELSGVKIYNPADKSFHEGPYVKIKVAADDYAKLSVNNFVIYRALTGDKSDNIPGIPGMGPIMAFKCFPKLGSIWETVTISDLLEESRERLEKDKIPRKIFTTILKEQDAIRRNYQLMHLDMNAMSAVHVEKINRQYENFEPKINKFGFIKSMVSKGISSDINFDLVCQQLQTCLFPTK